MSGTPDWRAEEGDRVYGSTVIGERWGTVESSKDSEGLYRVRWDDTREVVDTMTDADIIRLHRGCGPFTPAPGKDGSEGER